jgi:hypothetical protein
MDHSVQSALMGFGAPVAGGGESISFTESLTIPESPLLTPLGAPVSRQCASSETIVSCRWFRTGDQVDLRYFAKGLSEHPATITISYCMPQGLLSSIAIRDSTKRRTKLSTPLEFVENRGHCRRAHISKHGRYAERIRGRASAMYHQTKFNYRPLHRHTSN